MIYSAPFRYKFSRDDLTTRILHHTFESPKSARDISNQCNIPLSTVYRKLKKLRENHLLLTSGIIDDMGVKIRLFSSVKNYKNA